MEVLYSTFLLYRIHFALPRVALSCRVNRKLCTPPFYILLEDSFIFIRYREALLWGGALYFFFSFFLGFFSFFTRGKKKKKKKKKKVLKKKQRAGRKGTNEIKFKPEYCRGCLSSYSPFFIVL